MLAKSRGNERRIIKYFAKEDSVTQEELQRIFTKAVSPMALIGFKYAVDALLYYGLLTIKDTEAKPLVYEVTEVGKKYACQLIAEDEARSLKHIPTFRRKNGSHTTA